MNRPIDPHGRRKAFAKTRWNARAAIETSLFLRIKHQAKAKNIEFALTKEELYNLAVGKCFYCDCEPYLWVFPVVKIGGRKGKSGYNKDRGLKYNGIDRVDSSIGYFLPNCVTACSRCNFAKNDMSINDFKEWIKTVYNRIHLLCR